MREDVLTLVLRNSPLLFSWGGGAVFRGGRGPEVAENTVRAIEAPEGRHLRRDEKKIRVPGDGYGTGVLSEGFANRNKKGPTFR